MAPLIINEPPSLPKMVSIATHNGHTMDYSALHALLGLGITEAHIESASRALMARRGARATTRDTASQTDGEQSDTESEAIEEEESEAIEEEESEASEEESEASSEEEEEPAAPSYETMPRDALVALCEGRRLNVAHNRYYGADRTAHGKYFRQLKISHYIELLKADDVTRAADAMAEVVAMAVADAKAEADEAVAEAAREADLARMNEARAQSAKLQALTGNSRVFVSPNVY